MDKFNNSLNKELIMDTYSPLIKEELIEKLSSRGIPNLIQRKTKNLLDRSIRD